MPETNKPRWYYVVEIAVLFIILPLLYLFDLIPFHKIIPLIVLFAYCTVVLVVNKPANPARFRLAGNWKLIIARFAAISLIVFLLIKLFTPYPLLADLAGNRKLLYMLLMYPVLSVFPQELIFREFFFYRYRSLFRNPALLLVMNILLFSFAHIYFASWTVLAFTLVGGALFALSYHKTRSLLVVTIEHTLYGLIILSSGLAEYFYKAF